MVWEPEIKIEFGLLKIKNQRRSKSNFSGNELYFHVHATYGFENKICHKVGTDKVFHQCDMSTANCVNSMFLASAVTMC